ncbi:MAG TPA: hypothetical protein VL997_03935 [Dyella sp.]|nr:hypothetical protein [Dyella sp.]
MDTKQIIRKASVIAIVAASFSTAAYAQTRYFSFVTPNSPNSGGSDATTFAPHEFVIAVDNPSLANQISAIIENNYIGRDFHVMGKVVRGRVPYNEEYPFHLDPTTISLFSNATEQCDATAFQVEEHLELVGVPDGGFLNDGFWCPYSSRLVREISYGPISG